MFQTKSWLRLLAAASLLLTLCVARVARADVDPSGYWMTIDDDGKTPTSIIKIDKRGSKLYGKIVRLINPRDKNPTCKQCSAARKNKPIVGMEIMWDLTRDGAEWSGGGILDPNNGAEYKCYIELVDNGARLKVRGYVGIALLGRTQIWRRTKPPPA